MTLMQITALGAAAALTFAAGYCVGQREAPTSTDEKVLVVRDGSVEIFMDDLSDKDNMKHTWSVDAAGVDVLTGPPQDPCQTSQTGGEVAFDSVRFILTRGPTQGEVRATSNGKGQMELAFNTDDWDFRWNKTRRELVYQGSPGNLRLTTIYLKEPGQTQETKYEASGSDRLCARFTDQ